MSIALDAPSHAHTDLGPAGGLPEDDLLEVLEAGRYGVQYEPIVDLASGHTIAHEALARFHRANGSLVPTGSVFSWLHSAPSLLVETELALKRLQLERAPGHTLFVNLDPDSFAHAHGGGRPFLDVLGSAKVDVVVEAIENLQAADVVRGREMVTSLKAAGLPFALDDVGAWNGLVCFEMLAFADYLKFDRSIVGSARDERRLALVQALVAMAGRTGARTVLEGVERPEDLELARALGITLVQGTLFRERFVQIGPEDA